MGAQGQRSEGDVGEVWDDVDGAGGDDLDAAIDVETIEPDDLPPDPHDPQVKVRGMLAELAGRAGRIQIWRTRPTWCSGFLASIDIDEGDDLDLGMIKRDWGGGTIRFRPQARGAKGYQYIRGGICLDFTGPPMEAGTPLGRDGRPLPPQVGALPSANYGAAVLPGAHTGNHALDVMSGLFRGLQDRLGSIEQKLAAPAVTADPLADVKRTIALAQAFGDLKKLFGGDQPALEEADEEEEEEEEEQGPPDLEALGLRFLEKKLLEDETVQAELGIKPANKTPAATQPATVLPRAKPQPAPQAAGTQPAPRAAPRPAAAQAPAQAATTDPWGKADPWATEMEPGRSAEHEPLRVVEAEVVDAGPLLDADEILERLELMPKHEQHALLEKLGPRILEILGDIEK